MAHQLFIDNGFQATSIQDILDYSGISKGTFYNYFPSKNELLIAIFKSIYKKLETDRNELLMGQDPADIDIFIKQVELQMTTNRTNKLIALFEEVLVSNDEELKQFINQGQLRTLSWVYQRFLDIFGESKKPYLLDCAIMLLGILHQNTRYYALAYDSNPNIHHALSYSVNRIAKMIIEVSGAGEQLFAPELLDSWYPNCLNSDQAFQQQLYHTVLSLKKAVNNVDEQVKYTELLDFIQIELLQSKNPRKFLIESALTSLQSGKEIFNKKTIQELNHLVADFFMKH